MSRGDVRRGIRGTMPQPPGESWKERADNLQAALVAALEDRDDWQQRAEDAEARLADILEIAAPDRQEAEERLRRTVDLMLKAHFATPEERGELQTEAHELFEGDGTHGDVRQDAGTGDAAADPGSAE